MDVVSACPLRVASIVWQPRANAFALTIVAVASYVLTPGESPLADDQDEPNEVDGYWNDDERRSLHVASDLAPFKPRADVLLIGHAYAPRGELVPSLMTRLLVGDVDKSIAVYGDRVFTLDGDLRQPARFSRMPLRWERAAGGPDTSNPVGVRPDTPPDPFGMTPVPNLQPPGTHITQRGDTVEPVNYGPIAPAWPARLIKLHRYAGAWDHSIWHQRPVPGDIDPSYFNTAPADQQVQELRKNERIVLENLHPTHARLVTSLQAVSPQAIVEREGGGTETLQLRCDTLTIDTDRGRCTLAWRGAIALRHPLEAGRVVVTTAEGPRSPMPAPQPRQGNAEPAPASRPAQPVGAAAAPKASSAGAAAGPRSAPPPLPPPRPADETVVPPKRRSTVAIPPGDPLAGGLPFKAAGATPPRAQAPAPATGSATSAGPRPDAAARGAGMRSTMPLPPDLNAPAGGLPFKVGAPGQKGGAAALAELRPSAPSAGGLPFTGAPSAAAPAPASAPAPAPAPPPAPQPRVDILDMDPETVDLDDVLPLEDSVSLQGLPFTTAPPVPPPSAPPVPPPALVNAPAAVPAPALLTAPVFGPAPAPVPVPAFASVPPPVPASVPVPVPASVPASAPVPVPASAPASARVNPPAFVPPAPPPAAQPAWSSVWAPSPAAPLPPSTVRPGAPVPPPLEDTLASPPPLTGPLATPSPSPPAQDTPASPAPAPAEPPVAALPLAAYPLTRCAAIAASIDRRPAERDDILKAHDLAPDTWTDLERHWAAALLAEAERGRAKLSRAYDSAYVAQLEAERGFIDVSAYAKIIVAAERSDEARALADLDLPRAAILPIRRVWLQKIADDAALAASARKEIQAAQDEEDDE